MIFFEKIDSQACLQLFCFPYAGGGAAFFSKFKDYLPKEVVLRPVILPGRDQRLRDNPYHNIHELVEDICDELQFYVGLPFAFWGHCVGGLVAFEVARRLETSIAMVPEFLLVTGTPAPNHAVAEIKYHLQPNEQFIESVQKLNASANGSLSQATLNILLPGLKADFELYETYTEMMPGIKISCPIIACGSFNDERVPENLIKPWNHFTANEYQYYSFAGDHFFVNAVPDEIASLIAEQSQGAFHD